MGTIRFVLRIDKPLKNGTSPIDLIYQVCGQRKYYRTDIRLYSQSWDNDIQKAVYLDKKQAKKLLPEVPYNSFPTSREVENIEAKMQGLSLKIAEIEKRFELDKIPYSSLMVVEQLKEQTKVATKKDAVSNLLFDFMEKFVEQNKGS